MCNEKSAFLHSLCWPHTFVGCTLFYQTNSLSHSSSSVEQRNKTEHEELTVKLLPLCGKYGLERKSGSCRIQNQISVITDEECAVQMTIKKQRTFDLFRN
jgi:hypothetical protein